MRNIVAPAGVLLAGLVFCLFAADASACHKNKHGCSGGGGVFKGGVIHGGAAGGPSCSNGSCGLVFESAPASGPVLDAPVAPSSCPNGVCQLVVQSAPAISHSTVLAWDSKGGTYREAGRIENGVYVKVADVAVGQDRRLMGWNSAIGAYHEVGHFGPSGEVVLNGFSTTKPATIAAK